MNKKKIIGYTSGVFDLFHIGHLNILRNAKSLCDFLVVGVTTDEVTLDMKGHLPIIPFSERIQIVESIEFVDKAIPKSTKAIKDIWNIYEFNLMIKGDDWKGTNKGKNLEKELAEFGIKIKYLPYTEHTSSTILRNIISNFDKTFS